MVERIRELCKMNGISMRKLESTLGIGNGTIKDWDASSPSLVRVKKVADYFGITIDNLVGDEPIAVLKKYPQLDLAISQLNTDGVKMLTIFAEGLVAQPVYKKGCVAPTMEREA